MATISRDQAQAAKAEALDVFSRIGEVLGVGISKVGPDYVLKVNLRTAPSREPPTEVGGVPVLVELVGAVRPRR
jgi:hypothetical protein